MNLMLVKEIFHFVLTDFIIELLDKKIRNMIYKLFVLKENQQFALAALFLDDMSP